MVSGFRMTLCTLGCAEAILDREQADLEGYGAPLSGLERVGTDMGVPMSEE